MPSSPSVPVGNIVLIGFMGCGKTEIGRALAARTGRRFVDTDALVEAEGVSIPDIFSSEGENGFRRRERQAVTKAARAKRAVIATGGGAILDERNVAALKRSGVLVYLQVEAAELVRRLEGVTGRPLLDPEEGGRRTGSPKGSADKARHRNRVRRLLGERAPVYEAVADQVVSCGDRDVDEVAEEVLRRLGVEEVDRAPRTVRVRLDPPYPVHVGRGLLEQLDRFEVIPEGAERVCVVSHPRVRRLWGDVLAGGLRSAGRDVKWFTFPEGEERKTVETATKLHRQLARDGFHRSDALVALGGGVVGDVTGYVASTYARGIGIVQFPTTLLAMVDAAIGGKTGVNLPEGKNLVGTFHQPRAVVADLDVLRTLPMREVRGGLAEVMKYAFIADPELGELVHTRRDEVFARESVLEPIVVRSVEIKAAVVAEDERESGARAHLNYGHTLGHALEALSMAGRLKGPRGASLRLHHGEAIAVGMVYAAWVAVLTQRAEKDLVDEHVRLLGSVGLPTSVRDVAWGDVADYVAVDKKYAAGLRLVLLTEPGKPVVQGEIPQDILTEALRRVTEG